MIKSLIILRSLCEREKKKDESQEIINNGFAQNSFTKFGFISIFLNLLGRE